MAWKEYCAEHMLKELQESMDRCTGHHNVAEITLKTNLSILQSINLGVIKSWDCGKRLHGIAYKQLHVNTWQVFLGCYGALSSFSAKYIHSTPFDS